ncbi:MAG: DUF3566 domain-containing protein [Nocardioidaceae bacterium]
MSNTSDNGPLVPRRSLGRGPQSAETATQPAIPAYDVQPGQHASNQPSHLGASGFGIAPSTTAAPPMRPAPPQKPSTDGSPAPVAPPQRQKSRTKGPRTSRAPRTIRRAKLRLVRVDPWSMTKVSFLLSIAFGIMCVVAVFLVFSIMNAAGLWDAVNDSVNELYRQENGEEFDITEYVGMSRVMGITMLIAAVDVVLITALATLAAFIYNMGASLLGGVEVTLAEDIK